MADFEDANSPTWENVIGASRTSRTRSSARSRSRRGEKSYALNDEVAVLLVRPRGWHLVGAARRGRRRAVSGAPLRLRRLLPPQRGAAARARRGPYFYLPKLESHLEARLWNDVFCFAQDRLGVPRGTIKATVLIETILAAFEMDEILYELREHSAGLNAGRWDYIFS